MSERCKKPTKQQQNKLGQKPLQTYQDIPNSEIYAEEWCIVLFLTLRSLHSIHGWIACFKNFRMVCLSPKHGIWTTSIFYLTSLKCTLVYCSGVSVHQTIRPQWLIPITACLPMHPKNLICVLCKQQVVQMAHHFHGWLLHHVSLQVTSKPPKLSIATAS